MSRVSYKTTNVSEGKGDKKSSSNTEEVLSLKTDTKWNDCSSGSAPCFVQCCLFGFLKHDGHLQSTGRSLTGHGGGKGLEGRPLWLITSLTSKFWGREGRVWREAVTQHWSLQRFKEHAYEGNYYSAEATCITCAILFPCFNNQDAMNSNRAESRDLSLLSATILKCCNPKEPHSKMSIFLSFLQSQIH